MDDGQGEGLLPLLLCMMFLGFSHACGILRSGSG
jgi:hypothetical protein